MGRVAQWPGSDARGAAGTRAPAGSRVRAVRSAVERAHWPLDAAPTTRTSSPQTVMIHQAGAADPAKSEPRARPAARTAPTTATPRVLPVCRLVEAMAAATPPGTAASRRPPYW